MCDRINIESRVLTYKRKPVREVKVAEPRARVITRKLLLLGRIVRIEKTMQEVLAWREELQRSGTEGEIHFQLNSAAQYLEQLNHLLASLFLYSGLTEHQVRELTMAVRELGLNAIEWGHQKQEQRIVTVTYQIDPSKVTITIRDTGPGFDPGNLPHAARVDDPLGHLPVRETLGIREGGFGILMASGLVDHLCYNDSGNQAHLLKFLPIRRRPPLAQRRG